MKQIQLYIENKRVELFQDESITLTETIQNVRDVGKVFTPFSKSFTCPATKDNNKIFKHFYNFNLIDSIDTRKKIDAHVDLNYSRFHKGKVKFDGVKMKNNKPYAYKLTFYGNTVTLKDRIANDKLDALDWLNEFTLNYNQSEIYTALQQGIDLTVDNINYDKAFVVPLITHKDRLFYDSTHTTNSDNGNLHWNNNLGGVDWQQFKPSLRLDIIIKAIEKQYNINFSNDFFNENNPAYYNIYLWMHRKKGQINESLSGVDVYTKRIVPTAESWGQVTVTSTGFSFYNITSTPSYNYNYANNGYQNITAPTTGVYEYRFILTLETTSTEKYKVIWKRNGSIIHASDDIEGNYRESRIFRDNGNYSFIVQTSSSMAFQSGSMTFIADTYYGPVLRKTFQLNGFSISPNFLFNSNLQLPEISVMDLLSGLFKMFNLVCYLDYEGTVVVKTLDSWYDSSNKIYDITSAIDTTESTIDTALPYREIVFDFKGKDSFFAKSHNGLFNAQHGVEEFRSGSEKLSGRDYKIQLPFEHHKYERLIDITAQQTTTVQWGWSVDDNRESILGKPLLFYPQHIEDGTPISVRSTSGVRTSMDSYFIPSNSLYLEEDQPSDNLNFRIELNEYTNTEFNDTLFNKYYKNYITATFDPRRRLSKFKAKLPMSFLLNYTLNDRVIVFNNMYRINSITTNFSTQISNIELINISEELGSINNLITVYVSMDSEQGQIDNSNYTIDTGSFHYSEDL